MLRNLDCLEFLETLPASSVDLVLVDPPYFRVVNNDWDNQWDNETEYLEWCEQWTRECVRVLKDYRMLVVWGTLKTDTFLKYKLNILNGIDSLKSQTEIIWHYNWGGRTKSNFARKSELAWCYSKGAPFLFNGDDVRIERKLKRNIRTGKAYEKGTIPTNVWKFQNHTASKWHCGWHPTTKNIDCLERIIKAYTNSGDMVLDCFGGSGSTMIATTRTGRKFTGCELSKEYCDKSLDRYKELVPNTLYE